MTWMTIHTFGMAYQEYYLDASSSLCVGAVTKRKGATRYTAFFCNGIVAKSTTRGSFRTARDWVDGQYLHNPLS